MIKQTVILPASKSESNRALMIAAYGGFAPDIQNLSDSKDTKVFKQALSNLQESEKNPKDLYTIIDVDDCGAAARFLTTYLASHEGDWLLTGTPRLRQRPIKPLVDALMQLGADVQYVEREGFLPLHIHGKTLKGGLVGIEMTQSSQFASSLLLAAPSLQEGLELELLGEVHSLPYLEMTLAMMRCFGADVERVGNKVVVGSKPYRPRCFTVSSDWTAASYWYEIAALSDECEITLLGLFLPSTSSVISLAETDNPVLQGDAVIAEWMKSLGVYTKACDRGLILTKVPFEKKPLSFDFSNYPDLYPTMAATCAALGVEARFSGLENLRLKESDRVEAIRAELDKLGNSPLHFLAHNDHRIVMALAPLALRFGSVAFDHPEVVEKSYPGFWQDADFLSF